MDDLQAGETIGQRISRIRRTLGQSRGKRITQPELAGMVGVSRGTIAAWEGGSQTPTGPNLVRLAQALDTTPEFIMTGRSEIEETFASGPAGGVAMQARHAVLILAGQAKEMGLDVVAVLDDFAPPGEARQLFISFLHAGEEGEFTTSAKADLMLYLELLRYIKAKVEERAREVEVPRTAIPLPLDRSPISPDAVRTYLHRVAPAGQGSYRKRTAINGLREFLSAGEGVPAWWYYVANDVEKGRL
jgi:transcriptional regulator with XRE-family HTH domain